MVVNSGSFVGQAGKLCRASAFARTDSDATNLGDRERPTGKRVNRRLPGMAPDIATTALNA